MARTHPQAQIYKAHLDESHAHRAAAAYHEAATEHDRAAAAHGTAVRNINHAGLCRRRIEEVQALANQARARRDPDLARIYDNEAAALQRAAEFAEERAAHWHERGKGHTEEGHRLEEAGKRRQHRAVTQSAHHVQEETQALTGDAGQAAAREANRQETKAPKHTAQEGDKR